jgi:hypothetical protein
VQICYKSNPCVELFSEGKRRLTKQMANGHAATVDATHGHAATAEATKGHAATKALTDDHAECTDCNNKNNNMDMDINHDRNILSRLDSSEREYDNFFDINTGPDHKGPHLSHEDNRDGLHASSDDGSVRNFGNVNSRVDSSIDGKSSEMIVERYGTDHSMDARQSKDGTELRIHIQQPAGASLSQLVSTATSSSFLSQYAAALSTTVGIPIVAAYTTVPYAYLPEVVPPVNSNQTLINPKTELPVQENSTSYRAPGVLESVPVNGVRGQDLIIIAVVTAVCCLSICFCYGLIYLRNQCATRRTVPVDPEEYQQGDADKTGKGHHEAMWVQEFIHDQSALQDKDTHDMSDKENKPGMRFSSDESMRVGDGGAENKQAQGHESSPSVKARDERDTDGQYIQDIHVSIFFVGVCCARDRCLCALCVENA